MHVYLGNRTLYLFLAVRRLCCDFHVSRILYLTRLVQPYDIQGYCPAGRIDPPVMGTIFQLKIFSGLEVHIWMHRPGAGKT